MNDSAFMRWLAHHNNTSLVNIGRSGDTLVLKVSSVLARNFAIGELDGAPFLGLQQPELIAFDEIPWTHIDFLAETSPPRLILSSEGTGDHDRPSIGQLPVRVIIPARPAAVAQFDIKNSRFLDLRRIVVSDQGRVDRVGRMAVRRLPMRLARIRSRETADEDENDNTVLQQG
jgi:hypothetical protein